MQKLAQSPPKRKYAHQKHAISFDDDFSHQASLPPPPQPHIYNNTNSAKNRSVHASSPRAPPVEEDAVLEDMIQNNKIDCLYEIIKPDEPGPLPASSVVETQQREADAGTKKKRVSPSKNKPMGTATTNSTAAGPPPKTVETLLDYLKPETLDRIRLDFNEIYEIVCERLKPLAPYVMEQRERITAAIDAYITRFMLHNITQDKQGIKIDKLVRDIEKMYYVRVQRHIPAGKNDFENCAQVDLMRVDRDKAAQNQDTDKVYEHFSAERKRGRKNKSIPEPILNELEKLHGDLITPMKSTKKTKKKKKKTGSDEDAGQAVDDEDDEDASVVDETTDSKRGTGGNLDNHQIFKRVLHHSNKSLPRDHNHGWFLSNLLRGIQEKSEEEWPMCALIKATHNMQYCVRAEQVVLDQFDERKTRYYCAFSGLPLKPGETVNFIKLVEHNPVRYLKEPEEEKLLVERTFEKPEFQASVRCFYMKTELCGPAYVRHLPFSEEYKAMYPEYFGIKSTPLPSPVKREEVEPQKKRKLALIKEEENSDMDILSVTPVKKEVAEPARVTKKPKLQTTDFHVPVKEEKKPAPKKKVKSEQPARPIVDCDKQICVTAESGSSALWSLMRGLANRVATVEDCATTWHNYGLDEYRKNYAEESERFGQVFAMIKGEQKQGFCRVYLSKLFLYVINTSEPYGRDTVPETLVDMIFDVAMDFIGLLFEKNETPLRNEPNSVVRDLLMYSQQAARDAVKEDRERAIFELGRRPRIFNHYPFLFMILFDYLCKYKHCTAEEMPCQWRGEAPAPKEVDKLCARLRITEVIRV